MAELVGRIESIHRYPVKSMGGERLESALLTLQGLVADRLYAFVQSESRSSFPWLTARQAPVLLSYTARAVPGDPALVEVSTPGGARLKADSPELLAELEALFGHPVQRLATYRGSFDVAPVSIISLATVGAIAEASGTVADASRYRMTFTVDAGDGPPFGESAWVGRVLCLGEKARVAVTEPDKRCAMITLDHQSSAGSPAILKAVAQLNDAAAGVYGVVLTPGEVREGDTVRME